MEALARRSIQAMNARAAQVEAGAQALIDTLARAAFRQLWQAIAADPARTPRDAILAAEVDFAGSFADALAEAFGALLEAAVTTGQVRAMPVGGLTLSRRLYLHSVQTAAEVLALLRQHAQGVQEARQLARSLYDGYNPQDGIKRPLEGRARALLPRSLRALTEDLPARRELTGLLAAGQRQAARLKSPALRAAYLEAFRAWEQGAGRDALRRRLEVAQREKNRYFADRIALTELHRAHQATVARELMADEAVEVVQVRINPLHPREDICDLHARADLWGLGPGLYPKAHAPRPPYHPFCRCVLRSRPSLSAAGAVPRSPAVYLRQIGDDHAARVMGSADRARRVMHGEPVEFVVNTGVDPAYHLVRVGEAEAREHPLVEP